MRNVRTQQLTRGAGGVSLLQQAHAAVDGARKVFVAMGHSRARAAGHLLTCGLAPGCSGAALPLPGCSSGLMGRGRLPLTCASSADTVAWALWPSSSAQ